MHENSRKSYPQGWWKWWIVLVELPNVIHFHSYYQLADCSWAFRSIPFSLLPYFQSLLVLEPIDHHDVSFPSFIAVCLSVLPFALQFLSVKQEMAVIQPKHFLLYSFLAGNLIIRSGEELKINTTVPYIVNNNCTSCNYNASHEKRSSSHGEHLAAVIRFSGSIEFRNGSTVQVFGKYGLSITSQNGHILIETDIDMTCTEKVLDETCLGGFTQSSIGPLEDLNSPPKLVYKGKRRCFFAFLTFAFGLLLL